MVIGIEHKTESEYGEKMWHNEAVFDFGGKGTKEMFMIANNYS